MTLCVAQAYTDGWGYLCVWHTGSSFEGAAAAFVLRWHLMHEKCVFLRRLALFIFFF